MKHLVAALVAVVAFSPAARAADAAHAQGAKHEEASFIKADEVKWTEAPPDLPRGGQIAVLYGDPFKKGPYAIRLKAPDGYRIPPHWHSQAEQLTVIGGTLVFHVGDTMDSPAHPLDAGSFHFLPAKAHHSAEAKGETVVQINGMGPFDIHYLNPADNPNKATAEKGASGHRASGRRP